MTSQETYLTAFVEGTQAIAERFIQISQFDKTIQATINKQDGDNPHLYYLTSYGCSSFSAFTFDADKEQYKSGDEVYVNLPNGDYSGSNKYIIGKISKTNPIIPIRKVEDYITCIENPDLVNFDNAKGYQSLILEFNAYIAVDKNEIEDTQYLFIGKKIQLIKLLAKSIFTSETVERNILWSTNNLYGNIFNDIFPKKQLIVISNIENYTDFTITFEEIPMVEIYNKNNELISQGNLVFKDIKYSIGYDINYLENNNIYDTSILLTKDGVKYFRKIDDVWEIKDNINDLNRPELDETWSIEWYNYNPIQDEYTAFDNPVPQYWDKLEEAPETYIDKLVLLKAQRGTSTYGAKTMYSILRNQR